MPDARILQSTFSSGEIAPAIKGRIEHQRYREGAEVLSNFIIPPSGGAHKRAGTHLLSRIDKGSYTWNDDALGLEGVRLIPFVVDKERSYALLLLSIAGGCEILVIENYVAPVGLAAPTKGMYMNGGAFYKCKYPDTTNTTFPWLREELAQIDFAQVEDTMYLTHVNHKPIKIIRDIIGGVVTFHGTDVVFYDGPFQGLDNANINSLKVNVVTDHTFVQFTSDTDMDGSATGSLGALAAGDWLEFTNASDEKVIGKILHVNDTSSLDVANGTPAMSAKLTAQDNVLKKVDSAAKIESDQGDIEKLGDSAVPTGPDYSASSGHLLSLASIWSKEHEGYFFKHNQWDYDKGASDKSTSNRWVKIQEYMGIRVCKAADTDPILRTWGPSKTQGAAGPPKSHTIPDDTEVTADVVSLLNGKWRPDTAANGKDFHFENNEPAGNVFEHSRDIYAKVDQGDAGTFDVERDAGRAIRFDFNGKKVWGRMLRNTETDSITPDYTDDSGTFTSTAHGQKNGYKVNFYTTATLPSGLVALTDYYIINATANDFQVSLAVGGSVHAISNNGSGDLSMRSHDIPKHVLGAFGTVTPWYNSATQFAVKLEVPMPLSDDGSWATAEETYGNHVNKGVTALWQFGSWYSGSSPSHPKAVSFFQDRLIFAGSPNDPQTFWLSKLSDHVTFSPTDLDGSVLGVSGMSYQMVSSANNDILWIDAAENLLIGTSGSEWKLSSSSTEQGLSPTTIKVTQQTSFGSADVPVQRVGDSLLFVQSQGKTVRDLSYNYDTDSYRAIDVSVIGQHLFNNASSIVESAYVKFPTSLLFFRNSTGKLFTMTYEKEQKVVAASRLALSGGSNFYASGGGTKWTTATLYKIGATIIYDGQQYISKSHHTSASDFLVDYYNDKWEAVGALVMSMCSLPSSSQREPDVLMLATNRKGYFYNAAASHAQTMHASEWLNIEYCYPLGTTNSDWPYGSHASVDPDGTGSMYMDLSYKGSVTGISTNLVDIAGHADFTDNIPVALASDNHYVDVALVIYDVATGLYDSYPNDTHRAILIKDSTLKIKRVAVADFAYSNFLTGTALTSVNYRVGFPYNSLIKTLPLEMGGDGGTSAGRVKRINEITLRMLHSGAFKSGQSTIDTFDNGDFFSGDVTITSDTEYDLTQAMSFSSGVPQPMNVLLLSTEVTINR